MQADYSRIWPYVIAVMAVLLIYRRFRRSFGRQPVRPVRMRIRMGIFVVLAAAMIPLALGSGRFLAAEIAGLAVGIVLGVWGAQHTRYQSLNGELYYVPHTYTGIAVSMLLIGRLVYRVVQMGSWDQSAMAADAGQSFAPNTMLRSPFTVGLLFVVAGYYVCYFGMVLWRYKRVSPEELEVPTPNATSL